MGISETAQNRLMRVGLRRVPALAERITAVIDARLALEAAEVGLARNHCPEFSIFANP